MSDKKIRITQVSSGNGRKPGQQATLIGLGLNKISKSVELDRYAGSARHGQQGQAPVEGRGAGVSRLVQGYSNHETQ